MEAVHRALSGDRAPSLLEFIGEAQSILVIGDGREELLRSLDEAGYTVLCALVGSSNSDEARVFCQEVIPLARDATELPKAFCDLRYDVVLFDGALERLARPAAVLHGVSKLLEPGGCVVASIRNLHHGSVRLSTIAGGSLLGQHPGDVFTPFDAKKANELFTDAKLVVTRVDYNRQPLFGEASTALGLKRAGFSRLLVEEIEKDPRSEVYQFFVKASIADAAVGTPIAETASTALVSDISPKRLDSSAVDVLRLELERERETRERLLTALADLNEMNAALQKRIGELAERRFAVSNAARSERDPLYAELEAYKVEHLKLRLALSLSFVALQRSGQELIRAEDAWYVLYSEMNELRERAEVPQQNHRHHIARLESRVGDLESETLSKQQLLAEAASHVKQLLEELDAIRSASLADKAVMQAYADDVRERSERIVNELRREVAAATERERSAAERERNASDVFSRREEDLQTSLREIQARLHDENRENRELRERVAASENALAVQTDAVIATMQAENAHLSKLVDTVQSSRFWRFKRWLNRLRGSLRS